MRTRWQHLPIGLGVFALALCTEAAWAGPAAKAVNPILGLVRSGVLVLFFVAWLILAVAIVAFAYMASEYSPHLFRKGYTVLSISPVKSFVVGLVNTVLLFVVAAALMQTGFPLIAIGGAIVLLALLAGLVGSRALVYRAVGMRLTGEVADPESVPGAGTHFRGGAVAELAFMLPIVGWLAMIVITLASFGALVSAALTRDRPAEAPPASAE